jgi:hypothetical protein
MSKRFVIEGEWSGYRSSQQRVVHRTVHSGSDKKLRKWAEHTPAIRYTDGTSLSLTVRDCQPRERVKEIPSYSALITQCCCHNVSAVADLPTRHP